MDKKSEIENTNNTVEQHFEHIHSIIDLHRSHALKVVNNESLLICWNVGKYVSEKLKNNSCGKKVVTELSEYLRTKDPSLRGYSRRNIYNMVLFFDSYSSSDFLQLIESVNLDKEYQYNIQSAENEKNEIVQTKTAQLSISEKMPSILYTINWSNHIDKVN